MRKLCIALSYLEDNCSACLMKNIKEAGFDGVFVTVNKDSDIETINKNVKESGLFFDSLHGPFYEMHHMWNLEDEKEARDIIEEYKKCIDFCVYVKTDKIVTHPFIGFKDHNPNEIGVKRFEEIVKYAKEKNIKVCFENVEGEEYLDALMDYLLPRYDNVFFCLDSGHEMCYNRDKDMLKKYGKNLGYLHIDDNYGVSGKEIYFLDDFHLVPGDGKLNIDFLCERIKKYDPKDNINITLELSVPKQPVLGVQKEYSDIGLKEYLNRCYNVAKLIKDKTE